MSNEEVLSDYLTHLPDFVSNDFSRWTPIAISTFGIESETCKQARDCCDTIAHHSGCLETRRDKATGAWYLKQSKRIKPLRKYRGISLGMARDVILHRLMSNGCNRYYVFAKDPDGELWYLQSTALRHQDAFMSTNLLANKLGAVPLRVLPCSWPVPSPLTTEQMAEQEKMIKVLAWNLDCNQQSMLDQKQRGHEARMRMSGFN